MKKMAVYHCNPVGGATDHEEKGGKAASSRLLLISVSCSCTRSNQILVMMIIIYHIKAQAYDKPDAK